MPPASAVCLRAVRACLFQRLKASLCCSLQCKPRNTWPKFLASSGSSGGMEGVQRGAEGWGRESPGFSRRPWLLSFQVLPCSSVDCPLLPPPPPCSVSPPPFIFILAPFFFLFLTGSGEGVVLKPFIICLLPSPCCWQTLLVSSPSYSDSS